MKGMSKFQLVFTGIFGAFILIGVLVFAFSRSSTTDEVAHVTIWGSMSETLFNSYLRESGIAEDKTIDITYVEKKRQTFDQEFVEALAVGQGPDLFFLTQDGILKHKDKIYPIPFSVYSERTFKDTFVEEGELFLTNDGVYGLPFIIDPMVMYWNRDIFSNAGLSLPPKYWSEFYDLSNKLTVKDANFNVSRGTVALGEHGNITNANELISLLVMQAGSPITIRNSQGVVENVFSDRFDLPTTPALRALTFYTEFANPLKPFYSWNRALPESKNFFISGDLAMYFGFASELPDLRLKNPNLNFDVAAMPQTKDYTKNITFGRMVGLAIPRNSQKIAQAYRVASVLTGATSISELAKITGLPPVRRDLLAFKPAEQYSSLFYEVAIQSRAWLAPEPARLNPIFKDMIESVTSGRTNIDQSIFKTSEQLDTILR